MSEDDKPWEGEPDHLLFMSDAGYVCEISRSSHSGSLLGYIYIPSSHPLADKEYNDIYVDVHGGWTYAVHAPEHSVYGFDCAHEGDYMPKVMDRNPLWRESTDTYKTIDFVRNELEQAAAQFKQLEGQ